MRYVLWGEYLGRSGAEERRASGQQHSTQQRKAAHRSAPQQRHFTTLHASLTVPQQQQCI
eukprot:3428386-Pleurochrysis_carterae.AAC.1